MSEETTQNISDGRAFEERVFARFDSLDGRLQILENQAERRTLETKPIWERALAEIGEVKTDVAEIKADVAALKTDVAKVKADVAEVKADVTEVKADVAEVKADVGEVKERLSSLEEISTRMLRKVNVLNQDMLTMKADHLGLETRVEKLEPANP